MTEIQKRKRTEMKFYILRHGETVLNAEGVMQGRLDEPLSQSGRDRAKKDAE